ncbi:hypothetical protein ROLI_046080 (plasmid) [Roseobacter fucihabitans]|uniref:Glycosyltransferase RgtA/B/C/D-like domain-containing protein n=1 Tax=Roseobacter fucihabitans TaxID=1537242 RepID=A0ABZ2C1W4_9RHOB|nr:hypothetical protein [Roseobacter litoralis]MBC6966896.1 hypothetical protein [Roseobacter litoralis]
MMRPPGAFLRACTDFSRPEHISLPRLLGSLVLLMVLCFLLSPVTGRGLWIDETMAMANYPLASVGAGFAPLPFYAQAAPGVYSLFLSALANWPPETIRLIQIGVVLGLILTACLLVRAPWIVTFCVLLLGLQQGEFIRYASELKYYGLETASVFACTTWLIARPLSRPFQAVDALGLLALASCGNVALLYAVICLFVVIGLCWSLHGMRTREVPWIGLTLLGCVVLYGLALRGVAVQVHNYPQAYQNRGWTDLTFAASVMTAPLSKASLALFLVLAVAGGLLRNHMHMARWLLASVLLLMSLAVLIWLGTYPASHIRYFIALYGVFLAFPLAAMLDAEHGEATLRNVGAAGLVALVLLGSAQQSLSTLKDVWRDPHLFEQDDNLALVTWLNDQPATDVVLWHGAQPTIAYYTRHMPGLGKHRYLYELNSMTGKVAPELFDAAFRNQDYQQVSARVERAIALPGAWSRFVSVYSIYGDFSGPAEAMLKNAPQNAPFLIAASRMHGEITRDSTDTRTSGLLKALDQTGCDWLVALSARKVFVLRASCRAQE